MPSTPTRRVALAALAVVLVANPTPAADQPIAGTQLALHRSKARKEKLTFVAKDPGIVLPSVPGQFDPAQDGMLVELFSPVDTGGEQIVVPGGPGWSIVGSPVARYAFASRTAVVRRVLLQQGRQVIVKSSAIGLALAGPQGGVGVRLTLGTRRLCALFGAGTIVHDEAGRFVARHASVGALTDCSDVTGVPPVCGDGAVNQQSEQCDGAELGMCAGAGCGAPGSAGECQCCFVDAQGCAGALYPNWPCCGGESCVEVESPIPGGLTSVCAKLTCGPGDACTQGATCEDGGCCIVEGTPCGSTDGVSWARSPFPCCAGSVCAAADTGGGVTHLTCQVVAGRPCTTNLDCLPLACQDGVCG
jgi:hypothetical protein